jgi:hypothetical protein
MRQRKLRNIPTREHILRNCTQYGQHSNILREVSRTIALPVILGTREGIQALSSFSRKLERSRALGSQEPHLQPQHSRMNATPNLTQKQHGRQRITDGTQRNRPTDSLPPRSQGLTPMHWKFNKKISKIKYKVSIDSDSGCANSLTNSCFSNHLKIPERLPDIPMTTKYITASTKQALSDVVSISS